MSLLSFFNKENKQNTLSYKLDPTIEFERKLAEQIYTALQGPIVEEVLRKVPTSSSDAYWRSNMEGHSLKVEPELLKEVYDLCHSVKDKLGFTGKVDFYITGDSTVNAFSVASENENEPNIVNINSGLFDLMSREELKFVIGHELGHLINKDTALARLINFIFPPESAIPVTLQYKIRLHSQLAELVADRYGFMATEDLGACVTAFFKMASGLDLAKMNVSIDALIADNNKRLSYFLNDKGTSRASHPVNPIRVQALNLFATSKNTEDLQKGMDELISILLKVGDCELDEYTAKFIAAAGLYVASVDGEITEVEFKQILSQLATLKIFPRQYLEEIANGDIGEQFNDAVENILRINPGMREGMLSYMISMVMADQNIDQPEVDILYKFGESIGFSEIEVAELIAAQIQKEFVPSLDAIC